MEENIQPLRVAAVASQSKFGDVSANLSTILDWMGKAANGTFDVVRII